MFLEHQSEEQRKYYSQLLKAIASISRLFSEAPEPYIAYRATENLFCKAFDAENLSRSDASADASKDKVGIGLKTFTNKNGRTMQKVAEFNSDHILFNSLEPKEKIIKIAELRNKRLETTKRIFELDELIYHCVVRNAGNIQVFETPMPYIQIDAIKDVQVSKTGSSITFSDPSGEYSFNVSKSTLYKRFVTENVLLKIPASILEDPFSEIEKLISESGLIFSDVRVQPHVFLPLYSTKGGVKHVQEKSGLNQWNASGRPRDPNEIYIPIPKWIHKKFPNFFPGREVPFELMLPNRDTLSAKLCQDGSKALMSNPNANLGKWLLRDVLNLTERELLTYEKLQTIGLDSVVIYKVDNEHYDIDFTRIGSYEQFADENSDDLETANLFEEND